MGFIKSVAILNNNDKVMRLDELTEKQSNNKKSYVKIL